MNYTLKQSQRKTLALKVADGKVTVYAPIGLDQRLIEDFVQRKADWIQKRLRLYRPLGIDLNADSVILFGEYHRLVLQEGDVFSFRLSEGVCHVVRPKTYSDKRLIQAMEAILKQRLDAIIKPLVVKYCHALGVQTAPYIVRKYKRIYGRCASNHCLGFNTYLYHEDLDFIRYVVLHECAHLIEFNHSQKFYALIASIMPDYKSIIQRQRTGPLLDLDQ